MWLDVREGTHLVSSRTWPQSHMESKKMELTLAHEIRARAIACTSLGCIGHVIRCGRCRKERRLLFLCAMVASSFVAQSDEFLDLD